MPPAEAPQGLRPVAKRVPAVQGRAATDRCDPRFRSSPRKSASALSRARVPGAAQHEVVRCRPGTVRVYGGPGSAAHPLHFVSRCTVSGTRARISQPRDVSSTNGKPPGGDPAAPVRRRSCRGAGSATAGARLGMW
jgi:hypothetical protein